MSDLTRSSGHAPHLVGGLLGFALSRLAKHWQLFAVGNLLLGLALLFSLGHEEDDVTAYTFTPWSWLVLAAWIVLVLAGGALCVALSRAQVIAVDIETVVPVSPRTEPHSASRAHVVSITTDKPKLPFPTPPWRQEDRGVFIITDKRRFADDD